MRLIAALAIVAMCSLPFSFASAQVSDQEQKISQINLETFQAYDQDGDGLWDSSEHSWYATNETSMNPYQAAGQFSAMDADGSGALTFSEFNGGVCCG